MASKRKTSVRKAKPRAKAKPIERDWSALYRAPPEPQALTAQDELMAALRNLVVQCEGTGHRDEPVVQNARALIDKLSPAKPAE